MGLTLSNTLSSYAQQAGVSDKDLNGDSGKALSAADKILNAAAQSGNQTAIDQAIDLDAEAFQAANSKDKFSDFQGHVSSVAPGATNELNHLEQSNYIDGNSSMGAFVAALSHTLGGSGGPNGPGGMTPMSVDGGMFWDKGIHHYQNTSTVSVGSPGNYYTVQYEQKNGTYNQLSVKDPQGNDVPIPDNMQNGAPGTMTLANGATIKVGPGGQNATFEVDYQGQTQTTAFHGAGPSGGADVTSGGKSQAAGSPAPAPGAAPAGAPGAAPNGAPSWANQNNQMDPGWVGGMESQLANEFGTNGQFFTAGAGDLWNQEFNPGSGQQSGIDPSKLTGQQLQAYQAGQAFAAAYHGGGTQQGPSLSQLNGTFGPNGKPGTTPSTAGNTPTTAAGGTPNPSNGGTYSMPSWANQNNQMDPGWVGSMETQLGSEYGTNAQFFTAGAGDLWNQEFNPGSGQQSGIDPSTLSGQQLQAYQAGQAFAAAYHGGGTQSGPSLSQLNGQFGPSGALPPVTPGAAPGSTPTPAAAGTPNPPGGNTQSMPSWANQNNQMDPGWVGQMATALANTFGTDSQYFTAGAGDLWNAEFNPGSGQQSGIDPSQLKGEALKAYQAGQAFAAAYHGGGNQQGPTLAQLKPQYGE